MWDFSEVIHWVLGAAASSCLPGNAPALGFLLSSQRSLAQKVFFFKPFLRIWGNPSLPKYQSKRWKVFYFEGFCLLSSLLSCGTAWTLFWLGKVVSLKKKLFFCFCFFFSPILSCSLGWTFHQCYSEYRSFSSEAISRIFGSSEDKTSPQIRQCCATGKTLFASLLHRLTFPFLAFDL